MERRVTERIEDHVVSRASVVKVIDESSTVKRLTLKIHDKRLTFKAGQWADVIIPKLDTVGGFSMCSAPRRLTGEGLLDLAVKRSDHPPAQWIHIECKEGTEVDIRIGGNTHYDPDPCVLPSDLLLIAGGIGINPLYSILRHATDLIDSRADNPGADDLVNPPSNVLLLYSAGCEEELIFQNQLCELAKRYPRVDCQFFVTKKPSQSAHIKNRRISADDLAAVWKRLTKDQTLVYICGPSPMIETMETTLVGGGMDRKRILYEKWW